MGVRGKQPEAVIQGHVFHYLSGCREFFGFCINNGGTWDPRGFYRAHKGVGYVRGVSDIVGLWRGQGIALEIKTEKGRLTEDQKKFQQDYIRAGGLAFTVRSVSDVVALVESLRLVGKKHELDKTRTSDH